MSRLRLVPMRPRDPEEPGRVASSLELFFDLVFVVAVGIAASQLHHQLAEGHVLSALSHFLMVFFAIWWAWMNFTWFATSFDTDDWLYRVLTIVQMGGVLVLAAGIVPLFEHDDFRVLIYAYVVMRVAMAAQWLRATRASAAVRGAALAYAVGVGVVQVLWLVLLLLPPVAVAPALVVLILAELSVPVIAEQRGPTPRHAHHITERYGLFTLIVLGESLLASANAIIEAVGEEQDLAALVGLAALTLVATAALWWIYFWPPHHTSIGGLGVSLLYGYGHYFILAGAAAFSAGIEVEIDVISGHGELEAPWASFAYTIPIAVFLLVLWVVAIRRNADSLVNVVVPVAALLVLIDPLIPVPFAVTTVVLIATVAVLVWRRPTPRGEEAAHVG